MKTKQGVFLIISACVLLFISFGCVSNPFGDDEISGGNRKLSGRVQLSDQLKPQGVYVWLEGLNIGTRTDENGGFEIIFPPPASQSSGGVSGVFNLLFYMANFNLVSKPVSINNGLFVYAQGEINKSGEFVSPIFLFQSLSIETIMAPSTMRSDSGGEISARVFLKASRDSVDVFFPRMVGEFLAPLIFHNLDTDEVFIIQCILAGIELSDYLSIYTTPYERIYLAALSPGILTVGKYEVISYLFLANDQVPEALLKSLGEDIETLGANYLKIPFLRQGGQFQVN